MRRFAVAVLTGAVLAGSLLTSTSTAQVSVPALPSLTTELILDIARVPAPEPGIGLQIHADFPTENPLVLDGLTIYSLTADITPEGTVLTRTVLTREDFATAGSDSGAGVGECDDPAFVPTGVVWAKDSMPILWRFDRRSTPEDLEIEKTVLTVRSAHRVWRASAVGLRGQGPLLVRLQLPRPHRQEPQVRRSQPGRLRRPGPRCPRC